MSKVYPYSNNNFNRRYQPTAAVVNVKQLLNEAFKRDIRTDDVILGLKTIAIMTVTDHEAEEKIRRGGRMRSCGGFITYWVFPVVITFFPSRSLIGIEAYVVIAGVVTSPAV